MSLQEEDKYYIGDVNKEEDWEEFKTIVFKTYPHHQWIASMYPTKEQMERFLHGYVEDYKELISNNKAKFVPIKMRQENQQDTVIGGLVTKYGIATPQNLNAAQYVSKSYKEQLIWLYHNYYGPLSDLAARVGTDVWYVSLLAFRPSLHRQGIAKLMTGRALRKIVEPMFYDVEAGKRKQAAIICFMANHEMQRNFLFKTGHAVYIGNAEYQARDGGTIYPNYLFICQEGSYTDEGLEGAKQIFRSMKKED